MQSIQPKLGRWASSSNLRRLGEEVSAAAGVVAAAAVLAIGLQRLPAAATWIGWDLAEVWSARLRLGGIAVVGLAAASTFVRAFVRYRRRRIDATKMARRIDTRDETSDLFSTALAAETGTTRGAAGLSQAVSARAAAQLPSVAPPIVGFTEPAGPLAAVGIAAALVALLPIDAIAEADAAGPPSAQDDALASPPLPEEVLEALEKRAEDLARLEFTPGIDKRAQEKIAEARRRLESLSDDPDRSLSNLAKAQQALEELEEQARSRGLHDRRALERMSPSELAEQMTRAMERGQTDTAAAMAEALAKQLEEAEDAEMNQAARALERALRRNPARDPAPGDPQRSPGSPSGDEASPSGSETPDSASRSGTRTSPAGRESAADGGSTPRTPEPRSRAEAEDRARWRNRAEELAENLRDQDSGSARAGLQELAEQMRERSGSQSSERTLDEAADEVRRARQRQLSEMNGDGEPEGAGQGGSPGEGEGEGQGQGQGESAGAGESAGDGESAGSPGAEGSPSGPGPGEGAGEGRGGGAPGGPGEGPPSLGGPLGGRPSGKPGPGGGDGRDDTKGASRELPSASTQAPERVEARPTGPAQGSVRAIRRYSEGYRDNRDYQSLHDKYESIAESAVRREEIPLTRRDYIRSYFQAVRGR